MSDLPLLRDGAADARYTLLLAHGAGAGMDSPFMHRITRLIVEQGEGRGGVQVVRFDFPYMAERARSGKRRPPDRPPVLLQSLRQMVDRLAQEGTGKGGLFIGGKSMGGRMASLIADECGVAGLVCLGYPFHPPGKPEKLRTEHLARLTTPTLICQGERDTMGSREEVSDYSLSAAIHFHWLADGDHSFKPRKRSGRSEEGNLAEAAAAVAGFIASHN
jgi:predicted alpha/beta-hydrolase family hydrolase